MPHRDQSTWFNVLIEGLPSNVTENMAGKFSTRADSNPQAFGNGLLPHSRFLNFLRWQVTSMISLPSYRTGSFLASALSAFTKKPLSSFLRHLPHHLSSFSPMLSTTSFPSSPASAAPILRISLPRTVPKIHLHGTPNTAALSTHNQPLSHMSLDL